jgi:hypothetical protein
MDADVLEGVGARAFTSLFYSAVQDCSHKSAHQTEDHDPERRITSVQIEGTENDRTAEN